MAQPTPYDRQANFSNEEALNPTGKTPGASLDAEFNAVKVSLDQTQANLSLIQRDDGKLRNGSVTADTLASSLSIGFTLRGAWTAPENYISNDGVTYDNAFWRANVSHLSYAGDPPDDADSKWTKVVDFNLFAPAVLTDGQVTNAKLRDSAALSVIGRAANTTGAPADITAGSDGHVLRRNGTTLGFGQVGTAGVADDAITPTKLSASSRAVSSPVNMGITLTASVGALTIALVDANGSTPSATSPVLLPFRSLTTGNGVVRTVTGATTLTLSSGSTLGASAPNAAFALWIVAFDDAGTVRLGVINCLSGNSIYPLGRSQKFASSTAEGGAGGADGAHTFYTGTAVSGKSYVILARATWEFGLPTLGTWAGPSFIETWHPGMKMPGDAVQIVGSVDSVPVGASSTTKVGTATGANISLTSACNMARVRVTGQMRTTSAAYIAQAQISRGATFNGVGSTAAVFSTSAPSDGTVALEALDFPNTTSSTSYIVFIWGSGSAASAFIWLPNAVSTSTSVTTITEIQV